MTSVIERVTPGNYPLFDAMVYWRDTGTERPPSRAPVSPAVRRELANPNLFVYAALAQGRYVGWISLVYLPKVGKWSGRGHIYVDELWVAPSYRRRGIAKALMAKADELREECGSAGIRLYVATQNPAAQKLYAACGYRTGEAAYFMEKTR